LFGDGAINRNKKKKKRPVMQTLHNALRAMMQFPVLFSGDTSSPNKELNSKAKNIMKVVLLCK
jgi:hypothetical protein